MPAWTHELAVVTALAAAVAFLAWRAFAPRPARSCARCSPPAAAGPRGRRSPRLRVVD